MNDRIRLEESLELCKQTVQCYVKCIGTSTTKARRDRLMRLLAQTQDMEFEVLNEMEKRGWYEDREAPSQRVEEMADVLQKKQNVL